MPTTAVAAVLVPPVPVQVSEKVVLAVIAAVVRVPLVASVPLQPVFAGSALAVHAVALFDVHVRVDVAPPVTEVGFAVNVAVGAGEPDVLTVTGAVAAGLVPPAPLQVNEKVVFAVMAPVAWVPLVLGKVSLQPLFAGEALAVHEVAFVDVQVSEVVPPLDTLVGVAVNVTVGAGVVAVVTVTVADVGVLVPPAPVQVNV